MLNNFDYLWKRLLCVCVCVNSTFGRGCDCCKKLCEDKGSSGPSINSENNKIIMNEQVIKRNEEENKIDTNEGGEDEKKETLYFAKIDKAGQDDGIKKCFNNTWYDKRQGKVLLLKEAKENDKDLLEVTGSDNNWEITDQGKVLENAGCKPGNNKWIIVEVITLDENSGSVGDKFIFYVNDIKRVLIKNVPYGVFEKITCYSIKIIAANTRAVQGMKYMFYNVTSALERDGDKATSSGLIGLDKLNVANVKDISNMFSFSIRKQVTLDQLSEWRFSGEKEVYITGLFSSQVEGLRFTILNGWNISTSKGPVSFYISKDFTGGQVFVESNNEEDFTAPRWYGNIKEV